MNLITLYARREPTTDPVVRQYAPESKRRDVCLYQDRECSVLRARIPWHHANCPRTRRTITLNCYRWRLEWLPAVDHQEETIR